jgi:hypothetical protein
MSLQAYQPAESIFVLLVNFLFKNPDRLPILMIGNVLVQILLTTLVFSFYQIFDHNRITFDIIMIMRRFYDRLGLIMRRISVRVSDTYLDGYSDFFYFWYIVCNRFVMFFDDLDYKLEVLSHIRSYLFFFSFQGLIFYLTSGLDFALPFIYVPLNVFFSHTWVDFVSERIDFVPMSIALFLRNDILMMHSIGFTYMVVNIRKEREQRRVRRLQARVARRQEPRRIAAPPLAQRRLVPDVVFPGAQQ